MHEPSRMSKAERIEDADDHADRCRHWQQLRLFFHELLGIATIYEFHSEVKIAVSFARFNQLDNGWMIQITKDVNLSQESLIFHGASGHSRFEDLYRHGFVVGEASGPIDVTHPTRSEFLLENEPRH